MSRIKIDCIVFQAEESTWALSQVVLSSNVDGAYNFKIMASQLQQNTIVLRIPVSMQSNATQAIPVGSVLSILQKDWYEGCLTQLIWKVLINEECLISSATSPTSVSDTNVFTNEDGNLLEPASNKLLTSDVDNPQQNRRVEKKHRHILDTARALKFHAKLPLKFWGDRDTTTTYLINRMPSYVIGNVTPSEIPLKQKLIYDHLIVFGCLAIVSNPSRIADKFDPRGVPLYLFSDLLVQKDPMNFKEVVADSGYCLAMDVELNLDDQVEIDIQASK
ncbi:retrovirus-related pol polyprotein from transposon TNT 1-94 [Tanacetum coccineum]|uniref:Retrovirus-related pol polyprotein from transposon TNT 1-94 n=1 Tax=Tanacetum coccineum TaxID=301880 RepID=A0ABQ5FV50_9ASTR